MKSTLLFFSLLFINCFYANNFFQFELKKSEKLEGTFTAEIGNGQTIHFAIIKNTTSKDFFLTPFLVDNSKNVKKLDSFVSKKKFNIISYHLNNEIATIINYDLENKELLLIDYNIITGNVNSLIQELKSAPDNNFRLKNKSLLVSFDKKLNTMNIKSITDSKSVEQIQINVTKDKIKLFRSLIDQAPESINQEEFVKNGSISKRKGYFTGNNLIYTLEKDKNETQVFDFNLLDTKDFIHTSINTTFANKTKDISSYFYENKLFFLGVESLDVELKSFDIISTKETNNIFLSKTLINLIPADSLKKFIKTASKTIMKPTLTINKTKNNKLAFHLDSVEESNYSYNNNWFFMHQMMMQQQVMMQQQAIRSSAPRGFGPSQKGYFLDDISSNKNKKSISIEFVLDSDFNVVDNDNETIYPNIDKEKYIDKYKEDKTLKEFSSGFTNDEFRYIYQDKKSKTIIISADKL